MVKNCAENSSSHSISDNKMVVVMFLHQKYRGFSEHLSRCIRLMIGLAENKPRIPLFFFLAPEDGWKQAAECVTPYGLELPRDAWHRNETVQARIILYRHREIIANLALYEGW